MYAVGDLVIYGETGVCEITEVSVREVFGKKEQKLYYKLLPLYQSCTIYTPVDNEKIFMRRAISKDDAEKLIDLIPSMKAVVYDNSNKRETTNHYNEILQGYNCTDLVEMTMSMQEKKQQILKENRKMGAVDERFMKRAEELLFSELAAALEIDRESVTEYIKSRVANI